MNHLQEQAIQLLPAALAFVSKIASGESPGASFYRVRARDTIAATRLLLCVAEGSALRLGREDLQRLKKIDRRYEREQLDRRMLIDTGVAETDIDAVINTLAANELNATDFLNIPEATRLLFLESLHAPQPTPA